MRSVYYKVAANGGLCCYPVAVSGECSSMTIETTKAAKKSCDYKGLRFAYMENYIASHANAEQIRKVYDVMWSTQS